MSPPTPHIDTESETRPNQSENTSNPENGNHSIDDQIRTATIYRDTSGKTRGVALWIDSDQLRKIGIDLADTTGLEIQVTNDGFQLTGVSNDV